MIHIFLNGLAASSSSGLTYIRNVAPHLSARPELQTTLAVNAGLRQELQSLRNVSFLEVDAPAGAARRFWFEQTNLPKLIQRSGADVLISAGNFALRKSPVPQILLSGNSLYTSADFNRDLRRRRAYRLWMDTRIKSLLARKSIRWADCTVAPTEAYAEVLRRWAGSKVVGVHHGFDPDIFFLDQTPLPAEIRQKLDSARDSLRLLFVSHYNYYRNFETLLRALPLLRERLGKRDVKLFLTCKLRSEENPGSFRAEPAAALVQQLGIAGNLVELGAIPYRQLHHVYRACHIYVTPAYTETFAHPLVEAMASGLPVVASDLAVHREVCGEAGLYFSRFAPSELAEQILQLAHSEALVQNQVRRGQSQAGTFSWKDHVDKILSVAEGLRKETDKT